MAGFSDRFERRIVPRWHTSDDSTLAREAQSLKKTAVASALDTREAREELARNPAVGVATDALNVAIAARDPELAEQAAEIVIAHAATLPGPVVEMAKKAKGLPPDEIIIPGTTPLDRQKQRIRDLRTLLQAYPRSPLLHLDMARSLVTVGQTEKARRSVSTAHTLAPENRTVLRAAARFMMNAGDKEQAHRLIRNAERTRHDPWLIAAEIALSQNMKKAPKFWRPGRDFIKRAALSPLHLSELAVAMGTQELLEGNRKDARKLFAKGLQDPTENAMAQVRWAEAQMGTTLFNEGSLALAAGNKAYEAEFLHHFNNADIQHAGECSERWFEAEPFSSVAASAVAYVASLVDDYQRAEQFARLGLIAHPDEPSLYNNYLYARISSGDIFTNRTPEQIMAAVREIVRKLRKYVEAGDIARVHALANLGLLAFRLGQHEDGRQIYESAILSAQKMQQPAWAATAAVFFAREAILSGAPWATQVLDATRLLTKPYTGGTGSSAPSVAFYMQKIEALAKAPADASRILSPQSSTDYAPTKPEVKLQLSRKPDGGLVVWVPPGALR